MTWELESLSWIQDHRIDILNPVMKFFSFLGNKGWFWIVLAIVLLAMNRTRRIGIEVAVAMLLMFIVGNLALKHIFDRVRPYEVHQALITLGARPHDASFPSGHSMQAFAASTAIFLNNRKWGTAALIVAALIAVSRLYNAMHYPTDVIAGVVLGIAAGCVSHILVSRYMDRRKSGNTDTQ